MRPGRQARQAPPPITPHPPVGSGTELLVGFLKSGQFALYFPEYRDLPLVAVFSSLRLPDDVITYLTRNGIYAVSMGEETMQVRNRDAVAARQRIPPAAPAGRSH